jgi:hypothetical protein
MARATSLDVRKEKLREEAAGADPTTLAAYQRERDRGTVVFSFFTLVYSYKTPSLAPSRERTTSQGK